MSTANLGEIMARRYSDRPCNTSCFDNQGNLLSVDTQYERINMGLGFAKPPLEDMLVLWPGVEGEMVSDGENNNKQKLFQSQYSLQDQLIAVMLAIKTGVNTNLNTMLDYWDAL